MRKKKKKKKKVKLFFIIYISCDSENCTRRIKLILSKQSIKTEIPGLCSNNDTNLKTVIIWGSNPVVYKVFICDINFPI